MLKKTLITSSIFIVLILVSYYYSNKIIRQSFGRDISYFLKLIKTTSSDLPDNFNFIILGLDRRNDSLEKTETTDTIIFNHFNHTNAQINTFPLPRDLWSYDLKSKINQVYPQSKQTSNRFTYIADSYSKLINQPIHRSIIISTENLIELTTIIDGVDINLPQGFTDKKYPNPDYIKNPNSKIPVYKTISFPQGLNHLDATNITEFVRSRKSAETSADGGTDLGRIQRQELLIDAIINKLKQPSVLLNFHRLSQLYTFWQYRIETNFSDTDLVSLLKRNRSNLQKISIVKNDITPFIYHPDSFINPQWVFLPLNNDYKQLQEYINAKIN